MAKRREADWVHCIDDISDSVVTGVSSLHIPHKKKKVKKLNYGVSTTYCRILWTSASKRSCADCTSSSYFLILPGSSAVFFSCFSRCLAASSSNLRKNHLPVYGRLETNLFTFNFSWCWIASPIFWLIISRLGVIKHSKQDASSSFFSRASMLIVLDASFRNRLISALCWCSAASICNVSPNACKGWALVGSSTFLALSLLSGQNN